MVASLSTVIHTAKGVDSRYPLKPHYQSIGVIKKIIVIKLAYEDVLRPGKHAVPPHDVGHQRVHVQGLEKEEHEHGGEGEVQHYGDEGAELL